jgi:hypothetical protein
MSTWDRRKCLSAGEFLSACRRSGLWRRCCSGIAVASAARGGGEPMTKNPVSRECPKCHGTEFKRVRPEGRIAFTDDRLCKTCGARYRPPTPLWAAVLFIVLGALILLVDIAAVWVGFRMREDFWLTLRTYVFLLLTLSTGVGCIVYGLRCIRRQDDTPSTADGSRTAQATGGN